MTIQNDFLTFAGGSGANVLTQAQYAALSSILANGFQSGVANSAQLNKVWRQSSIMAAVMSAFIVDQSGQPAVDDGTTATLEANLIAGIRNVTKTQVILTDTGSVNAYAAVNSPALTALPAGSGLVQRISIVNANTGASTYAPDGLSARPIYGLNLSALQGGELVAKGIAVLMYLVTPTVNGGNGAWILIECTGGAMQVPNATQSQHAVPLGQMTTLFSQASGNYSGHAFFSANSTLLAAYSGRLVGFTGASSFTLTLPLSSAVADGAVYHFVNFTSLPQTIAVSGTDYITPPGGSVAMTSITLLPGETVDICGPGGNWDLVGGSATLRYSSLYGTPGLFSVNAGTVASNALTIGYPAQGIEFRSATLTSGLQSTIAASAGSLTIPSGATLGTVSGQQAILVLLALNVSGTAVPAVVNLAGGVDLSETGLISTTAISSSATSASVVYSAAAQTNVPYRVIGAYYVTEATAGTWATAPSQAIGAGGQAFSSMMSAGYGQTLQNVTGSRAVSTTYYNTTPRPIKVRVTGGSSPTVSSSFSLNGTVVQTFTGTGTSGSGTCTFVDDVPPGSSYSFSFAGSMTSCFETR